MASLARAPWTHLSPEYLRCSAQLWVSPPHRGHCGSQQERFCLSAQRQLDLSRLAAQFASNASLASTDFTAEPCLLQCHWNEAAYQLDFWQDESFGWLGVWGQFKIYHLIFVLESNYNIYVDVDVRCQKKWLLKQPPLSVPILSGEESKVMGI